jgi:hypothetical protein
MGDFGKTYMIMWDRLHSPDCRFDLFLKRENEYRRRKEKKWRLQLTQMVE